jgi:hypothetical protein
MKRLIPFIVFIFFVTTLQTRAQEITATLAGSASTDGFSVKEGSNTLFRVRGDGNVGIGTTSPDHKLTVNGDIRVKNIRGTNTGKLRILGYNETENDGKGIELSAEQEGIDFRTYYSGWASRMFISDAGNVGIGTTTPGAILHTYATLSQNPPILERSWNTGGHAELLNLSFTTTSNNATAGDGGIMSFIGEDNNGNQVKYAEVVATIEDPADGDEDGALSFRTSEGGTRTEQVRITSAGNVGIGTTGPQGALDVVSTTGAFIVPRMTTSQRDALTAVNGMIIYNSSTNQFNFYENGAWVTK